MSKLVEAQRELRKQANVPIPDMDILRMLGHEQEKSKNMFSALRAHNECRASFALNKKSLAPLGPSFWQDVLRLKDAVRDDDDFYSEFLHAYLQSPFYISRDRELGELFWSINNQFIKHSNNAYYDPTVDMYNLVRSIRNEVILENWDKYRKAYIFDIELEKAFLNIKNGEISLCAKLIDYLPFNTFYIKLPEESELSQYYDGAFVSVRRSNGYLYIEEANLASYKNVEMVMKTDDPANQLTNELIEEGRKMSEEAIKGLDNFVSLHMTLVNKTPEPGFGTSYSFYTFMYAMPYDPNDGEGGLCRASEEEIKTIIRDSQFDHGAKARKIVLFTLNALMYLSAKNADIQSRHLTSEPAPSTPKNKYTVASRPVELNECGFVYGSKVREIEKHKKDGTLKDDEIEIVDEDGQIIKTRNPPAPHPVSAFTRRYHVGKGRTEVIWKWIPPGYAGLGKGNVNVSKVESTS